MGIWGFLLTILALPLKTKTLEFCQHFNQAMAYCCLALHKVEEQPGMVMSQDGEMSPLFQGNFLNMLLVQDFFFPYNAVWV